MPDNPLDRAKERWGSAEVMKGGGQGSQTLDLTPWAQIPLNRMDEGRSGIADVHYDVFFNVATARRAVIVVRRGKYSCVRWIKMGYPAKPASVWKVKNSQATGLVTCSGEHPRYSFEEQMHHAWDAGHYVLVEQEIEEKPLLSGAGKGFVRTPPTLGETEYFGRVFQRRPGTLNPPRHTDYLRARRWDELLPDLFPKENFHVGVVIDPASHLPLTGDYDLMGAFPIDNPGGKNLTMVHSDNKKTMTEKGIVVGTDAQGRPDLAMATLTKMRNNPYCTEIAKMLNAGFGGRSRIMHGAHDLKFDPVDNNDDGAAVFHPQGAFFLKTAMDIQRFYQDIGRYQNLPGPERHAERATRPGEP